MKEFLRIGFDGFLGAVILFIAGIFVQRVLTRRTQTQRSGQSSTNLQAGRDIHLGDGPQ
jgi:hypothetical protein